MKPEKTKRNISLENILNRELKRCTTNPKPYYVYPLEIKNRSEERRVGKECRL